MIEFLQRIVDMDTATENQDGVEALAQLMAQTMTEMGLSVERREGTRPTQEWVSRAFMGDRHGSAIAPSVPTALALFTSSHAPVACRLSCYTHARTRPSRESSSAPIVIAAWISPTCV